MYQQPYQQPYQQQQYYPQQQGQYFQQQPQISPMIQQPIIQQPIIQQPMIQQPMMMQPVYEQPVYQQGGGIIMAQPAVSAIIINTGGKSNCDGSRAPQEFICPHCNNASKSNIVKQPGSTVWICLPLCMDECQDTYHYCPKCKKQVGFTAGQGF